MSISGYAELMKMRWCVPGCAGICRQDYDEADYTKPCAFLIGNEGNGLDEEIAQQADTYIKIPMAGRVESLNAAIASSVLMFEAARQRRHM